MKNKIPAFKNEDQERAFWAGHDSADFIDWRKAERSHVPNLKPSLKTISLRLPETMLKSLKMIANKRDIPYQSLLKIFLAERLQIEQNSPKAHTRKSAGRKSRKTAVTVR
ncbi:MAG: hypothetical protein GF398_17645 [Chitinivibrionales bacterium]|nr:hypothetical protein [Chitinivibrionales bacterium]